MNDSNVASAAEPSIRQANLVSRSIPACRHLPLLLTLVACGFPRPKDVPADATADASADASEPSFTLHVAPSGDDANDGFAQPVKTLKHAIGLAAEDPRVTKIVLASGTYSSSSGETFPYTVPPNVTIAGPAGGGAILAGTKAEPGVTVDRGELQDLDIQDFTVGITVTGQARLQGIRVLADMIAVQIETAGVLSAENLSVVSSTEGCATGVVLNGNAVLMTSGFTGRALGASISATGRSSATVAHATLSGRLACQKEVISMTSSGVLVVTDSVIDGGYIGISIASRADMPAQAMLTNVVVRNTDSDALLVNGGRLQVNGGELSRARQTSLEIINGDASLDKVSVVGSRVGFYVQDATFRLRNCVIASNVQGGFLGVRAVVDLGTILDPGGNVIANSGAGLFLDNGGPGPTLVEAVGNTWKPVQGADQNGRYPVGTILKGPFTQQDQNFSTADSNMSVHL